MLGINGFEFLIIFLFTFLIFGPDRLPAVGRVIGRAIRQFRHARDEVDDMLHNEMYEVEGTVDSVQETFRDMKRVLEEPPRDEGKGGERGH